MASMQRNIIEQILLAQGDLDTQLEGAAPVNKALPFEWVCAHYFIMGTALFSIAWGSFNAFLVSKVDMDRTEPI